MIGDSVKVLVCTRDKVVDGDSVNTVVSIVVCVLRLSEAIISVSVRVEKMLVTGDSVKELVYVTERVIDGASVKLAISWMTVVLGISW